MMLAKQPIILTDKIVPPPARIRGRPGCLPAIVRAQGERASRRQRCRDCRRACSASAAPGWRDGGGS
jgi:hypothetical protein